jgi:hypothetical protein
MKGDYSRSTFRPRKRYTSVRVQQGRVQLDADWNEQADILRDMIATQARDLMGSGAAADEDAGFALGVAMRQGAPGAAELPDLTVGAGWYYVDGLRCDNVSQLWYSEQPGSDHALLAAADESSRLLAYLDVWERHITAIEAPELREPALGGPDTTARTTTAWQIRLLSLPAEAADKPEQPAGGEPSWAREWRSFVEGRQCKAQMEAKYKGYSGALGNHLYRVEIHGADRDGASFKWSRENGAVAFPILHIDPISASQLNVHCALIERDRLALAQGDIVELEDDQTALGAAGALLCRVTEVRLEPGDGDQIGTIVGHVRLSADPAAAAALGQRWRSDQPGGLAGLHPLLRRWDHNGGHSLPIDAPPGWQPQRIVAGQTYELERGLTVCFEGADGYTSGDYWQIVARADVPSLELPARPPDGIVHHYAPIGLLARRDGTWDVEDLRRRYRSVPQLSCELDRERGRLDTTISYLARLRSNFDALVTEIGYLRRKVKDVRGRLYYDYRSDEQLELGQVVAADPAREGHIVKANEAIETLVIGVVGEILTEHEAPLYRVVIYGLAPCKVVGAVVAGDLLTVATAEGNARRGGVFLRPGTVIGKALRSFVPNDTGAPGLVDAMITLE